MTTEQSRQALILANEVRIERARIKRNLKRIGKPATQVGVATRLLADHPQVLDAMPVKELLKMIHTFGPLKAARTFSECRITQNATFGGLTNRQKEALTERLNAWIAQKK